ncbi:hypothetical protein ACIBIZ_31990 [Nonomuraea spiralis]|uniref:Uncharacterized protein n=1 Tax=Nonomuraea spiralis TaxID=46182 RepID=A0ABV5IJN7_9ACTN|nr:MULTISPECIES: hypothetical protein [Nonomuraea]RSN05683.1 hypothetical protein DMB42_27460 [Nonomuraea sp. WAC 01424]
MAGSGRRGVSPAFSFVLSLVAGFLLVLTVPNLGTVVRAARADGAPGVFVPRTLSCITHPGHESCVWTGDFRSDDGAIRRSDVEIYGSDRYTHQAGQPVRAVDIGSGGRVYGPGGSNEWVFSALLLVVALGLLWFLHAGSLRRLLPGSSRPGLAPGPEVAGHSAEAGERAGQESGERAGR